MENQNKKEVFVPVDAPKLSPGMLVRTVVFVVAVINAIAAMLGFNLDLQVNQVDLYEIFSGLFLIASGAAAWFKNNDVTKKARKRKVVVEQVEKEDN